MAALEVLVFKGIVGSGAEELLKAGRISYVKDSESFREALSGEAPSRQAGFLLRPMRIEQLRAVAARGERMPQKTTYFYPKLLSGIVFKKA